jgi:outer membrane protein OmpA-like peptidoglycan-associated protein
MRKLLVACCCISLFSVGNILAQKVTLEGYVFEADNRGFLNEAIVTVLDESNTVKAETATNLQGFFTCDLEADHDYIVRVKKELMYPVADTITTKTGVKDGKVFAKIKMNRRPGYLFDVTLSESAWGNEDVGGGKSALTGSRIEIFNNTTGKEELVLADWQRPGFQYTFEQGNHYTVMVRKEGYITKRLEAHVNIDGCILCFEGLNNVRPEVSDVMTHGNEMGTLLANIELQKAELNKSMRIENIYYDYNKWDIRSDAAVELDKVINMMRDNPTLILELGSHTDARGKDEYNMDLSQKRAQSAVDYIVSNGKVSSDRIKAKGYGETQIINRCRNGVECPDQEHERNRRTEIKIIGFTQAGSGEVKSLRQIIMDERIEKIMSGEESLETIKVEDEKDSSNIDDEIAADLKRQEERKKQAEEEAKRRIEEAKRKIREEARLKAEAANGAATDTTNEVLEEGAVLMPGMEETIIVETPATNNSTTTAVEEQIEEATPPRKSGGIVPIVSDAASESPANGFVSKPKPIDENFTGYKIEFYNSNAELPASHQIFSKHGNIEVERKKDGTYAYLLGDFGRHKDAKHFLDTVILPRYPNAKLVGYRKGVRISESN